MIMEKKFKILTFYIVIFVFAFLFLILAPKGALAEINIDPTYHYAWNDVIGWIDFYFDDVHVVGNGVKGYATSSVGYIALDCATSPNGNICGSSDFGVENDGSGNLSGYAWNDAIGWISFDSATAESSYIYQVTINTSTGDFSGYAWNDVIGWISFNCSDPDVCAISNYKVNVNPETGEFTGYAWNDYVGWISVNCSDPGICSVSNYRVNTQSGGAWEYLGPDGSETTYYAPTGPNIPVQINLEHHNNQRYFRYKAFLISDASQSSSPTVDDVIINYSP